MSRTVLIVDNNSVNRKLLKNVLRTDYDILEAEDGKEALAMIHRHYRLLSAVLLDIVVPEMDGYEILSGVKDNPLLTHIPVIMATDIEDETSIVKALSLGVDDFIYKPFNPDIIRHCLKNNITLREKASILNAVATPVPAADYEARSIQEMLPVALNAVMSSSSELAFVKDKSLRYICCSRAVWKSAGLGSEAEIIGKSDYDIMENEAADEYLSTDQRVMESGEEIVDSMDEIPQEDGTKRYYVTSKFPLKDSQGNIVGIYGIGRDITESRIVKSQLELLTNSVPGGIAVYEACTDFPDRIKLTYFSDGVCGMFGYTRSEYQKIAEADPMSLVFPEDRPALMEQIKHLLLENKQMDCIYRTKVNVGGFKWINLRAVAGDRNGSLMTINAVMLDVTERQEALEKLKLREEESRLALQHSRNVVCRYDVSSGVLVLAVSVSSIFELASQIEDVPYGEVRAGRISPETADKYIEFYESIRRGEKNGDSIYQRQSALGWRWIEAHFSTIFSNEGKPASAVISFIDVTDKLEKDAVFKKWQQSIRERKPEAYSLFRCSISKKKVIDVAEGSLLQVKFKPGTFSFDEHTEEYVKQYVLDEDAEKFKNFLNVEALILSYYHGKRVLKLEYREKMATGHFRWLLLTVDLLEAPHSTGVEAYLLFEDIDEAKRSELAMIEKAKKDPLTGLFNRGAIAEAVDERIMSAKPNAVHALLMLDLDGFKMVNDVFGHGAGDQTLIDVAETLKRILRHDDLVGRMGGDEFVVFLNDIPGEKIAAGKAKQICELTRKTFNTEVRISSSVGIALCPLEGVNFEALYKKADEALYYVKGSGRNNYAFYSEGMEEIIFRNESEKALASEGQQKQKRRMLIVDDSRIDYELMANMFCDDFITLNSQDGYDAIMQLRHYGSAISVVLLDLMMPGMDGFSVLERMQQSQEMSLIPVIVVSGAEDRETSLRAIRSGAADFVTKPVDPDVLRIRVQSAVSKADNERLRAKNSYLEMQSKEMAKYRIVMERIGLVIAELDLEKGLFTYSASLSKNLYGTYDNRTLWHILLFDMVAEIQTVENMQQLVRSVSGDKERTAGSITVQLKAASGEMHWFRMSISKIENEYASTDRLILAFTDLGAVLDLV